MQSEKIFCGVAGVANESRLIEGEAARNPDFRAGDSWRLDVRKASPASRVYLQLWKDNLDLGVSGPYGSVTDSGGTWTLSGSFGAADAGSWQLQTVMGTASSQEASGPTALRVLNA